MVFRILPALTDKVMPALMRSVFVAAFALVCTIATLVAAWVPADSQTPLGDR